MLNWKKQGLIFAPPATYPWMNSHAQVPFTLDLGSIIRTYFSTRESADSCGMFRSYSGYVDFDKTDLSTIIEVSEKPILPLGSIGQFDEFGSMAGSVVQHNDQYFLYYCGWTRCSSVPYNWAIGLAISDDASNFSRYGPGPLLGPTFNEPYLQACPIVYKLNENEWHMFYLSGVQWINNSGKLESQYLLMHATSCNGLDWNRDGKPIIKPIVADECQTSASIFFKDGRYNILFSYRHGLDFRDNPSKGYRIGYAHSSDLITWHRDDSLAGIDVSSSGWDSRMVAYPHVFDVDGTLNMFYCGNNFGTEGFGWAILSS